MIELRNFNPTGIQKRSFGDFEISCVTRSQLVDLFYSDKLKRIKSPKVVFDVNGHALSLAKTNKEYRSYIKMADIIHADGGFLITLSKILPGPVIPERSATTDMIHDFAKHLGDRGVTFYLLGGTEEVNRLCFEKMHEIYPNLRVVGRRNGYFCDDEADYVIDEINALSPDIVWIGLGKPNEQKFSILAKNRLNCTWIVTCGGCFNYITGHYKRAPKFFQKMNLEWLHRMASNPKKLFFRYLFTTPHALLIALRNYK